MSTKYESNFSVPLPGGSNVITALASPPPIGSVAPNTGAFTTLAIGGIDQGSVNASRAPSGGIYFPGVAGARATATLTNQNIGTDACSLRVALTVPSTNLTGTYGIALLGTSATTSSANNNWSIYFAIGNLYVYWRDVAGATNSALGTISGFVAANQGKSLVLTITRTGSTLAVYADTTAQTVASTYAGSGSWAGQIDSTYLTLGAVTNADVFTGKMNGASLYNRALSAADITALVTTGVPDPADQWGSQVPFYSSDFSATAANWATDAPCVLTANQDGINGQDDWLKVETASSGGCFTRAGTAILAAAKYGRYTTFKARIYNDSGSSQYFQFYTNNAGGPNGAVYQIANGAQLDISDTILLAQVPASYNWGIRITNAAGTATPAGVYRFYTKNINLITNGCITYYPCAENTGSTCYDASGNTTGLALVGGAVLANPGAATVPVTSILASSTVSGSGLITTGGTIIGGAGNMTITAGTGNSRTMALQTTSVGGVATTFLSANATQDSTFAGTVAALKAGTMTSTIESSVNGALSEFIIKGKNSTGTARQMNFGINKFADDVFSFYDGTTERLRLGITTGDLSVPSTTAATAVNTGAIKNANLGISGTLGGAGYYGGNWNVAGSLAVGTDLTQDGQAARSHSLLRNVTANTAGNNLTIQGGGATVAATDKDGGRVIIAPGLSTGTAKSSIRIQRSNRAASTGTTDNALVDGYILPSVVTATAEGSINLFEVALPAGAMAGGYITFQITGTDGTELQVHSGHATYAAINKGGVYNLQITDEPATDDANAASAGALTDTWAITAGTDKVTISVTVACSTITANDIRIYYTIHNGSSQAVTQL